MDYVLFYGATMPGIKKFIISEEDTVGKGVYLTSQEIIAQKYSLRRINSRGGIPVVYEVVVTNVNLIDLRNKHILDKIFFQFKDFLKHNIPNNASWHVSKIFENSIHCITEKKYDIGSIRLVVNAHCKLFTEFLQALGYDGLITIEGGEGSIPNHDTYLIFNPRNINVLHENKLI